MGAYIYFTPSNIFFFLRGRGSNTDEAEQSAEEKAKKIWAALRHQYGWEIDNTIERYNHTTGQKYEPIKVDDFPKEPYDPHKLPKYSALFIKEAEKTESPQLGKYGEVDNTPVKNTIHSDKLTVDAIIERARFFAKHKDEIVYLQDLQRFAEQFASAVKAEVAGDIMQAIMHAFRGKQHGDAMPPKPDDRRDVV